MNPVSAQRLAPVTEDAVTVAGIRSPYLHAGLTSAGGGRVRARKPGSGG